jgi:hypothetical protein
VPGTNPVAEWIARDDCRRTFARNQRDAGAPREVTKKIVGWTTDSIFDGTTSFPGKMSRRAWNRPKRRRRSHSRKTFRAERGGEQIAAFCVRKFWDILEFSGSFRTIGLFWKVSPDTTLKKPLILSGRVARARRESHSFRTNISPWGLTTFLTGRRLGKNGLLSCEPWEWNALMPMSLSQPGYCLNTNRGPLTRFPWRSTVTSTRSAILMNGMPLFMP